jgi:hypothetical protein
MMGGPLIEVEAYLQALSRVRVAVKRLLSGSGGLVGLLGLYRLRSVEKTGTIREGLEYNFHGSGCLFIEAGRAEVDVDFLGDDLEVFDAWRVKRFSTSVGIESPASFEEILEACRSLVSQGRLMEPRVGWFSVAE